MISFFIGWWVVGGVQTKKQFAHPTLASENLSIDFIVNEYEVFGE